MEKYSLTNEKNMISITSCKNICNLNNLFPEPVTAVAQHHSQIT